MSTKQTETAPSFLQIYTQVRRDRMKHSLEWFQFKPQFKPRGRPNSER